MKKIVFKIVFLLFCFMIAHGQTVIIFSANQADELLANAGNDDEIISGLSVTLGETPAASGGSVPYSYSWSNGSNDISTEANPTVNPAETTSYYLVITDNNECTATDSITISIIANGINDFNEEWLKVYPNPANDMFTIDYCSERFTISLLNEQGTYLWTKRAAGKTHFSAPRIPGIYILKITSRHKESVRRIVVSK